MSLENLKILNLRLNEYKWDLLLLILSGFLSNFLIFSSRNSWIDLLTFLKLPQDYNSFPLPFALIEIAAWVLLFLILRAVPSIINTFLSTIFRNKYKFDSSLENKKMDENRFAKEWLSQGNTIPYKGGLLISNSNSGCFIKNNWFLRAWREFSAIIEIDFPMQKDVRFEKRIGIIFRAQNFEDYLLIELYKDKDLLKFRPHVRLRGNWDAPLLDLDEKIQNVSGDSFTINLEVSNNVVTVYINDRKSKTFKWIIPTHVEVNLMQKPQNDSLSKTSVPELYFRNKSGMFGFRCFGNQFAFVKSLSIS